MKWEEVLVGGIFLMSGIGSVLILRVWRRHRHLYSSVDMLNMIDAIDATLVPYYNDKIQLHQRVILDILDTIRQKQRASNNRPVRMLVFGLGYDSALWYHSTHGYTYFVENHPDYIELNKDCIPASHITHYGYEGIRVLNSFFLSPGEIASRFPVPGPLKGQSPFDIILVDGPNGYFITHPGRLLPIYWSFHGGLSKGGTTIYIDDSARTLETHCIRTLQPPGAGTTRFPYRSDTLKITLPRRGV